MNQAAHPDMAEYVIAEEPFYVNAGNEIRLFEAAYAPGCR